jgi:3-dehydroquinate dehydratase I
MSTALKLGRLWLDRSVPVVAAGFVAHDDHVLREALGLGLDVAELRVDLFKDTSEHAVLAVVAKFSSVPTIATVRIQREGGQWTGSEKERLQLFSAMASKVDAIDVELNSDIRDDVVSVVRSAGKLAVVSFHDFAATPPLDALVEHVDEAVKVGAHIVKIATHARGDADVQTLARLLLLKRSENLIVIAMGSHGTKSRVFFPALGSLITFASVGVSTAPGQLELDEMVENLRFFYPSFSERKAVELKLMHGA